MRKTKKMKKIMAIILIAALVLSMNGCVSIYTLLKASDRGNESDTEEVMLNEPVLPSLKPNATPAPSADDDVLPIENASSDTDVQKADEEQKADEQNAAAQDGEGQKTGYSDGLHINQTLLDCLSWHLSDLETYCGGTLPPIAFEDDVVFFYALPGYWDTYLAFTYANEAENQTDDAKLVRIETCTISAFARESVSAAELKNVAEKPLSVEKNDSGYFLKTEIDGVVCRFVAQSKIDPEMTNLIIYEKYE